MMTRPFVYLHYSHLDIFEENVKATGEQKKNLDIAESIRTYKTATK